MDHGIRLLAQWLALLGGAALIAMITIVCMSVTGRFLIPVGLAPIRGDYEIVEGLAAFAVFAFLPWCQLSRSLATVDVFAAMMSQRTNRAIDLLSDALMTVFFYLVTWRLCLGMLDKINRGDKSFILGYPMWWVYAAGLLGAVIACIVSTYLTVARLRGRPLSTWPGAGESRTERTNEDNAREDVK